MEDYTTDKEVSEDSWLVPAKIMRGNDIIDLVFSLTQGEGFIAGGFARWCLSRSGNPIIPGDIDVFLYNEETYAKVVKFFKNNKNCVRRSASRIETKYEYKLKKGFHTESYFIQLIRPSHIFNMVSDGDFRRVLDNFDFTISKCAILPSGEAWCHEHFHLHDEHNELHLTNIHCPISSAKRVVKYVVKGYTVESREILKLFEDYENRSQDWKDLIKLGFSEDPADYVKKSNTRKEFIEAMYFD